MVPTRENTLLDVMRFDDRHWCKAFRTAVGASQHEVERHIGHSTYYISCYEKGDRLFATRNKDIQKGFETWSKEVFNDMPFETRYLVTIKAIVYYLEHSKSIYLQDKDYVEQLCRLLSNATNHFCDERMIIYGGDVSSLTKNRY